MCLEASAYSGYCFTPYIVGNSDPAFSKIPEHHQQRLDGLEEYWQKEAQKRADERSSGLVKTEPEEEPQKSEHEALNEVLRELDRLSPDRREK